MIVEMEEVCLHTDPIRFIFRIGAYGERVVNGDLCRLDAAVTKNGYMQVERIWFLKRERMLPTNIVDILFVIRKGETALCMRRWIRTTISSCGLA